MDKYKISFIIKRLSLNDYFAGFAGKAQWVSDATKAKTFDGYGDAEQVIKTEARSGEFSAGAYQIDKVYEII